MNNTFLYLSGDDVHRVISGDYQMVLDAVEDAIVMLFNGTVRQPDKISQIMEEHYQNRINCMPATLTEIDTCGMKWVSVFPSNQAKGLSNVEGLSVLSEIVTGGVTCVMNSSECTSLRTAGVGAVAAKYLARKNTRTIGFIGAGDEARAHFRMIKHVFPVINKCYVSSRTDQRIAGFIEDLSAEYDNVEFVHCGNDYRAAAVDADIIVTAISSQEQVLKAAWIKTGALYIHVAGLEDEFAVAQKAQKIICDSWDCVKHRSQTITQMYRAGLLTDDDIYGDIGEIIAGQKNGRENDEEFIYFNSVGLAAEDVLLSHRIYEKARQMNVGTWLKK